MTTPVPSDGLVDGHVHVWSADADQYPWRPVYGSSPPGQPGTVEWVLEVLERHGVRMAVAVQSRAYGDDHAYLADALDRYPGRIVAVAALDPHHSAAPDQLTNLAARGIRGLRLDPMGWGVGPLADRTVLPLWDRAAELGLEIELMIRPEQLAALAPLIDRTPSTPIVIEHLARYDADPAAPFDGLLDLARRPNVFGKLSALAAISCRPAPHEDLRPLVRAALAAFGPERLMWGSDMPWIGGDAYGAELEAVRHLSGLDDGGLRWLLGGTARRVFGMESVDGTSEATR